MFRALWNYRGFVFGMVKAEFYGRYMTSVLGAVWAIVNPLVIVLIFTLVFSQIMRARLPGVDDTWAYGKFLCAGYLCWNYFNEVVSRGQVIFLQHVNLLKNSAFPRIALPAIVFISASLNFVIIFALFLIVLTFLGDAPGLEILGFVPLLVLQQSFAVGLGLIIGTLNVFFRDIGQFMGLATFLWFWLTPVVYPLSILPERMQSYITTFNPLTDFMLAYQNIILNRTQPELTEFGVQILISAMFLVLAYYIFRRLSGEIVDEL